MMAHLELVHEIKPVTRLISETVTRSTFFSSGKTKKVRNLSSVIKPFARLFLELTKKQGFKNR